MDTVFAVALVVVALVAIGASPLVRRYGDLRSWEAKRRSPFGGTDVERQFEKPRNEGDLL